MDSCFRSIYNDAFSDRLYRGYASELSRRLGATFEFRLAETPVFIPGGLRQRLVAAAADIMGQLTDPARLALMKAAIPAAWNAPGMSSLPTFTQLDFAVVQAGDGSLSPRLIELQGFPSLTAMQVIMRDVWDEHLAAIKGLAHPWSCWFGGLDREAFLSLARRTIVGDHDPETVVLLDLDPPSQKTYPDFAATKLLFGVDAVCPTALAKRGRRLFRSVDGRSVPVKRIYHRVVFDELIQKRVAIPFDYREGLDVEWSPHPNWYWTWSKHSIPLLDHPAVPRTVLLSDLAGIPADLSRYVLKPLFSFAGGGVRVGPSEQDILSVPEGERSSWCLQERVEYAPALIAPAGAGVKVEIRLMLLRPDDADSPILAQNLCRLSRGLMMGVDYNKNYDWVGASVGLWPCV
jgi:hypothetical protein